MLTAIIITLLWLSLSGLLYFIIRRQKITLSFAQVLVFLGCKIVAGAVYGYIYKRFYNGDDTWGLHHDSLLQYKRLLKTPAVFISDIFSAMPVPATGEYYFQSGSYLANLEYCMVTKTLALFNLISQGNYYINVVFFNFLAFWGLFFLYKLLSAELTPAQRRMAAAVLFLFPPAVFWLSGIRTEGLLLLFTGILLYQFSKWLGEKKATHLLCCMGCLAMTIILRNGFAFLLVPSLLAWWVSVSLEIPAKKVFTVTFIVCIAAVMAGSFVLPQRMNALFVIANRQHEFLALKGNTRFHLTTLDGYPASFIKVLPEAALNTFARPFLWEAKGLLQWFAAIEALAVLLLLAFTAFIYARNGRGTGNSPLVWVLLLTGLYNYIITGFVVPFPGAIVRYKIIPELFLICACLLVINGNGWLARRIYPTTASLQI